MTKHYGAVSGGIPGGIGATQQTTAADGNTLAADATYVNDYVSVSFIQALSLHIVPCWTLGSFRERD
jgi:hypothetical protein